MTSVPLTERLLMDAGGWQAAKLARALVESGRVVSAAYTPPVLKGVVREGDLVRIGDKSKTVMREGAAVLLVAPAEPVEGGACWQTLHRKELRGY